VEYLPTPELGLFAAELLIGIICVGIFTINFVGPLVWASGQAGRA